MQSRIGESYKQVCDFLRAGRLVLFTGTPCQVSGLKCFLRKDYDNLICQDIVCHGVPSPKVWRKYVAYREGRAGSPARENRFQTKGWRLEAILRIVFLENDTEYLQDFRQICI